MLGRPLYAYNNIFCHPYTATLQVIVNMIIMASLVVNYTMIIVLL